VSTKFSLRAKPSEKLKLSVNGAVLVSGMELITNLLEAIGIQVKIQADFNAPKFINFKQV
jgi:hypothetical protein